MLNRKNITGNTNADAWEGKLSLSPPLSLSLSLSLSFSLYFSPPPLSLSFPHLIQLSGRPHRTFHTQPRALTPEIQRELLSKIKTWTLKPSNIHKAYLLDRVMAAISGEKSDHGQFDERCEYEGHRRENPDVDRWMIERNFKGGRRQVSRSTHWEMKNLTFYTRRTSDKIEIAEMPRLASFSNQTKYWIPFTSLVFGRLLTTEPNWKLQLRQ